jgi:hypothetical protein
VRCYALHFGGGSRTILGPKKKRKRRGPLSRYTQQPLWHETPDGKIVVDA